MARTIILAALLASLVACGDSSSTPTLPPTSSGPFTQTDLVVGTGNTANNGNRLTVSYTGWLYDTGRQNGQGNSFDSQSSFQFVIGTGAVIRGWDQGIVGMRIGGQRRLIIPPELAYGSTSPDPTKIPSNATLLFDISLLNVQ